MAEFVNDVFRIEFCGPKDPEPVTAVKYLKHLLAGVDELLGLLLIIIFNAADVCFLVLPFSHELGIKIPECGAECDTEPDRDSATLEYGLFRIAEMVNDFLGALEQIKKGVVLFDILLPVVIPEPDIIAAEPVESAAGIAVKHIDIPEILAKFSALQCIGRKEEFCGCKHALAKFCVSMVFLEKVVDVDGDCGLRAADADGFSPHLRAIRLPILVVNTVHPRAPLKVWRLCNISILDIDLDFFLGEECDNLLEYLRVGVERLTGQVEYDIDAPRIHLGELFDEPDDILVIAVERDDERYGLVEIFRVHTQLLEEFFERVFFIAARRMHDHDLEIIECNHIIDDIEAFADDCIEFTDSLH